ncbi:FUN14 domain-containing protein 2 [Fasciola gigantica]|uniref:FUN14 domain-containing protein 2 n=1 Tax=Fasciola gigantica TaxID=46835 RepID=A0A504Y530_FASGI|nr:FUN14 domain-containing protein 2 [Fasciola gigantica]
MAAGDHTKDRAVGTIQDALNEIKKRPHREQVIMGLGSGLTAGYIFAKLGRVAALLLGGGLIALQFAVQQDCIRIEWGNVRSLTRRSTDNRPWLSDAAFKTISENRVFLGSFGGGFLVAVALS